MPLSAELPDTIPIFPLPGALLLPRARLPLHIFEPRYLAMVEDTLKTPARLIGMVQPRETPNGPDKLQTIGCAGRLSAFSETEDGRYMITLSGVSRFRVQHEVEGFAPYRRRIAKPVAGSVRVAVGGSEVAPDAFGCDPATGLVTFAAGHLPPAGAAVTAGFAFDVPVRFDTDDLTIDLAAFTAGEIPKVPLVEIVP